MKFSPSLIASTLVHLSPVDFAIIIFYFALVIIIGMYLKERSNTGEDFFMAGREMTAWVAGLAFLSANLGSLELMGWAGNAYKYGILAAHWYWIGAIPAMLFLALVMMPFYYICKTHSVPGYLKLRYGKGAQTLSAISFAAMTVLMSGINMYAMAVVMHVVLGWDLTFSILISSGTVAVYLALGGLRSAIFNEVLQFFLIWAGALLIPILGLIEAGGWDGMKAKMIHNLTEMGNANPTAYTHLWSTLGDYSANPMGIHWTGIVFGLGIAISCGYWTTDFLVVQRVLAAKDLRSAEIAPIIGAGFKMMVPFIVILPGLLAIALLRDPNTGMLMHLVPADQAWSAAGQAQGLHGYDEVLPLMLARYCGPGLLGLGITALMAGFMSGMAGNVSAFATVWTYDIYGELINKNATDATKVKMGRFITLAGIIISIGTAYIVMHAQSIMDYVQALFSFFIAPLLGTVLTGMMWKRATKAAGFWGLLIGTLSSVSMYFWVKFDPMAVKYIAFSFAAQDQAQNMFRALWCLLITVIVTVVISLATTPKSDAELSGLVMGLTPIPQLSFVPVIKRPIFWGAVVMVAFVAINIIFW